MEQVVAKVEKLLPFRAPEKIFLNPDCGFGTFADRPVNTLEIAARKLRTVHEAAEKLRARHA